nr:hypothetical protein CFP56_58751 [Quercus suber]
MGRYQYPSAQYDREPSSPTNPPSFLARLFVVLAALGALYSFSLLPINRPIPRETDSKIHDFRDIIPSTSLQWTPCFDVSYQCARLRLPMDYDRPIVDSAENENPYVDIALIMAIKFGSSSVMIVILVSFDPRGVGYSTPTADCFSFPSFPGHEVSGVDVNKGQFERAQFAISNEAVGLVNSSEGALSQLDAAARAVGQVCAAKDKLQGQDSILRHVHTPNVARDMLSIVDSWDNWRDATLTMEQADVESKTLGSTKGKLVYYGLSYGQKILFRVDCCR